MELLVSKPKIESSYTDFSKEVEEYLLSKGFEKRKDNYTVQSVTYEHKELPIDIEANPKPNLYAHWDYRFSFVEITVCRGMKAGRKTFQPLSENIEETMQNLAEKMKKAGELAVEIATWIDSKMKE